MTKKELLNFIEQSNVIIDFDYNYLMRKSKATLLRYYELAKKIHKQVKKSKLLKGDY